jgi:hypothetical protein
MEPELAALEDCKRCLPELDALLARYQSVIGQLTENELDAHTFRSVGYYVNRCGATVEEAEVRMSNARQTGSSRQETAVLFGVHVCRDMAADATKNILWICPQLSGVVKTWAEAYGRHMVDLIADAEYRLNHRENVENG